MWDLPVIMKNANNMQEHIIINHSINLETCLMFLLLICTHVTNIVQKYNQNYILL